MTGILSANLMSDANGIQCSFGFGRSGDVADLARFGEDFFFKIGAKSIDIMS